MTNTPDLNHVNDACLNEALRIGQWLLDRTETDHLGKYWKTMTMDMDRSTTFIQSESIYSGVSGIVLFFLELFKQTGDTRFKEAAQQGMEWVVNYCREKPTTNFALLTGRMGISYTLLQMHSSFADMGYLEKALTLAKPCLSAPEDPKDPNRIDDFINGTSGTILGLLHLHAASKETWILEALDRYIAVLLKRTYQSKTGLYWDRSLYNISGLCGFSHGASGIGYVFLELGHYFQNDTFVKLMEQAFLYERFRYNLHKKFKNWPDLRKGIYTEQDFKEHRDAFLAGDMEFFTSGADMNAWCHGAAGIGLARLRAYQLLKNPLYLEEARIAMEKTALTDLANLDIERGYILCHGSGGNAELFLYAYQVLDDPQYLEQAKQVAANALTAYSKYRRYLPGFHSIETEEDTSLFMGNAGVGYFLLRVRDPLHVPSLLIPTLDTNTSRPAAAPAQSAQFTAEYPAISISMTRLMEQLLEKVFPRTLLVCKTLLPEPLNAFLNTTTLNPNDDRLSLNDSFAAFVETQLPLLPEAKKEILSDVFEVEAEVLRMEKENVSDTLLNIKYQVRKTEAEQLLEKGKEALLNRVLVLDPANRLTYTLWNWYSVNREQWPTNFHKEKEEEICPLLLKPTPDGINEYELTPFSYTVLGEFIEPSRVDRAQQATLDAFEDLNPEEETELKAQIIQQIEQALLAGVLTETAS